MRKKRKGSEADASADLPVILSPNLGSASSNLKSHYSLEDCSRLKKRCCKEEDAATEPAASFKRRLAGIATAPPCGTSSLITPGRGLKRKIGCIDVATQMGRKKKIEDDYVTGETIGQGKFGSVWLCRSRVSGAEYACKTLRKGEETVHREVEIMQHLSGHSGVVTLQAVYEEADCFHLVMELCSGGRLIDQMVKDGPYSEQKAANVLKEVMLVINYCHDMGVVHRDIKPENILLTASGKIKLADFGLAMRISEGQNLTGLAGSPAYVAPEVLLGRYSEKVDIWSAGVLLHALLVGSLPFQGDSLEAVFEAIKTVKLDFQTGMWESISKPARDLIGRMLTRDISARISADEVLRHPWILFYTAQTLTMLPIKSKLKNQIGATTQQFVAVPEPGLGGNRIDNYSLSEGSFSESCTSDDQDESVLIDVLASAISHVRISEPKRSRVCGPTGPIVQQGSSNMKPNNLCKAF
ncbi:serine/threonine-protein kinase PEPKR2 [Vigna radiata var. radiata]|uniref:Serine/threonine-protein kinase PEPKR2 n=1 Tax=Vigna radiata var. radiata TaxID=3916 RepID=A0A1S3U8P1_VIGRR|nr:serine/threonine-protein kinase PEPKR2 [Vigna radiata var. radiata]XP_014502386.1 serine/threonine-protein kinase PEPKR2 [Vigna radiata var. radiata]XP_022636414.1 serine/threonine-protein kinase PEPKR2 [Vigna radiata var. radiata]